MQTILLSNQEVAQRAKSLYENKIRQQVESADNLGKMVIIDIETGNYEVDKTGLQSALATQGDCLFPLARMPSPSGKLLR